MSENREDQVSKLFYQLVLKYSNSKNQQSLFRMCVNTMKLNNTIPNYAFSEESLLKLYQSQLATKSNGNSINETNLFEKSYKNLKFTNGIDAKTRRYMLTFLLELQKLNDNYFTPFSSQLPIPNNQDLSYQSQSNYMPSLSLSQQASLPTPSPKPHSPENPYKNHIDVSINNEQIEVTDEVIIKDLLYVYNDIDGKYITFDKEKRDYIISPLLHISIPIYNTIQCLLDLARVYRKLKILLDVIPSEDEAGVLKQALYSRGKEELQDYVTLLAKIDRIQQARDYSQPSTITLKNLLLWISSPLTRLRYVYSVIDDTQPIVGGALLSALYNFNSHGDSLLEDVCHSLISLPCHYMFIHIWNWITAGKLPEGKFDGIDNSQLWDEMYIMVPSNIPSCFTSTFIHNIYLCGKYICFIRDVCQDVEFRVKNQSISVIDECDCNHYTPLEDHIQTLLSIYKSHLLQLLNSKYSLSTYISFCHSLYLFGKGDFIRYFYINFKPYFSRISLTVPTSALTDIYYSSIEQSSMKLFPKDIINQFTLKFNDTVVTTRLLDSVYICPSIPVPLLCIFKQDFITSYQHIFNTLLYYYQYYAHILSIYDDRLSIRYNNIPIQLRNRYDILLIHYNIFFKALQEYYYLDVIENEYQTFLKVIQTNSDLDHIIQAHSTYLKNIEHGILLEQSFNDLHQLLRNICALLEQFVEQFDKDYDLYATNLSKTIDSSMNENIIKLNNILNQFMGYMNDLIALLNNPPKGFEFFHSFVIKLDFNHFYVKESSHSKKTRKLVDNVPDLDLLRRKH
ncbi:hypothetical protein WA158_003197 [Blastocystis sp. Blastoise]